MRLLHFADLHLDTRFRWASPQQARNRRRALRETLMHICQVADEQRVDALTCGGDLYEQERFTPDTAEFLRATFAEIAPLPVFLAPGNHDWFGPVSLYRQIQWSPNVHVFDTAELSAIGLADGLTLWGAAHCAPANTPGFLDAFHVDRGGVHLALFHGSAQGDLWMQQKGKVPHAPFRVEQIERSGLHHALLGHFHHPVEASDYTYPGNPDTLSFGETWKGAAVLVTVGGDGAISREHFAVATSIVSDVSVDLTGVTHEGQVRERVLDAVDDLSGYVRVTLRGALGPDVDVRLQDFEQLCPANLDALVVQFGSVRVALSDDYETLRKEQTVRGQFVHDVLGADLTDNQRHRVLVTGLRALNDRIDDLEVH
ncbi:metallophosphoesterase [Mycobacterium sp. CVI_P3]|uniref:Metallophosphoesterase n=1 Tax=Mycobacterium pinniadriaticum TaxID=2994102 RepID=A0ABT3SNP5_9MYCO|nr:metallophosphoesterase [Mycobacterium pinniadriaticum]MCX2934707.1 metallophosphoesterase [Mycobacterium pinniadriaticum]MCX2941141.1 metallophosphoesterase [Mycobacterium pinniadriaticum]